MNPKNNDKTAQHSTPAEPCPDCGQALSHREGCILCPVCGYSRC
jgi:ribonucleoside-diphosphate reductase alpha chain